MKDSAKERKAIVGRLLLIKSDNWSKKSIDLNLPEIKNFLNELTGKFMK